MKEILLVEDETNVVSFIKKGLSEEGYSISVALDGETGLLMAQSTDFDLIILDIMLPDKSGIEVCREIRKTKTQTPILFLTALGTPENIALGLNIGGDDYLIKPFKFIELSARVNALLRRSERQPSEEVVPKHFFQIGSLLIDDDAKVVTRNGRPVNLTATEYRLLLVLVKNKGKVLSRMDLLESAWDIHFNLGTNVVDVYINYLRKKIDTDPDNKLIKTVIGMGYTIKEE